KPRSGVPPPQASVATKNQSGARSGTLPEGESISDGHLHHPGDLHDEEGQVAQSMPGEDLVHPVKVSLEELYNGISKKLSLARNVLYSKCNGKGSKSRASMKCVGCQGVGYKVQIVHRDQNDPKNATASVMSPGSGETISDKDRCGQCKGEKVVHEKKVLEVVVEKGMQHGQKITFPGEADEAPDTITGDIIFVLQQKEHPKFKRKADDLFYEHTLTLTEALCGYQYVLAHLDCRQLLIKSNPGEFVKPDSFKAINDEGMPMYHRPFRKGKLYIHSKRTQRRLICSSFLANFGNESISVTSCY
ncbi:hypothetical protein ZWY2020_021592, partial [Hordeum vulgare]